MSTPIFLVYRALNHYPIMYQTKISLFLCFALQVPKYGNLAPVPQILGIFKHYQSFVIILSIRTQRAFNHCPIMFQTQNTPVFVFGPQMAKYGNLAPDPQILGMF